MPVKRRVVLSPCPRLHGRGLFSSLTPVQEEEAITRLKDAFEAWPVAPTAGFLVFRGRGDIIAFEICCETAMSLFDRWRKSTIPSSKADIEWRHEQLVQLLTDSATREERLEYKLGQLEHKLGEAIEKIEQLLSVTDTQSRDEDAKGPYS
ncbi:MAG: hypothetical protein U1E25_14710 [Methylocystis sp.]